MGKSGWRGARLFAYGTLMVPSVAEAVLGRRPLSLPATLDGYARFRVWGEDFPGVIPCADHSTTGVLYTGLRAASCRSLTGSRAPGTRGSAWWSGPLT